MKKLIMYSFFVVIVEIFFIQRLMACPLPPTTIGGYYSGLQQVGQLITFTGISSHDNDGYNYGQTPYWRWDFDYNGTFVADLSPTSPYAAHTYSAAGTYTVAVI